MRVTTAFNRLLDLPGVIVRQVSLGAAVVTVEVALRRRRLACPLCSFTTGSRYDTRAVDSTWRHLDLGRWRLGVRARLRRLRCPSHGVRVEAVPFARNNHVRLITRRAYGFHSAQAALSLVMLSCGPIQLRLPHERLTE